MPITPETIYDHLTHLPQRRSLDAALELFDALGYQYADELPLPIRNWPTGIRRLLRGNAESPTYLAQHRDFRVVYTHLSTDHLARTVERPIVEQTLHKLNPYALFVFANRDRTLWDFVNVKYVAEDGAPVLSTVEGPVLSGVEGRRRTIRRIHIGPTERLHTAAQRLSLLAVPSRRTAPHCRPHRGPLRPSRHSRSAGRRCPPSTGAGGSGHPGPRLPRRVGSPGPGR